MPPAPDAALSALAPGTLLVRDSAIHTVSAEGVAAGMTLEHLFAMAAGLGAGATAVLPDGVKIVFQRGPFTIWVHQCPPCVRTLEWIAANSKEKFGTGTKYRKVTIALPYVIVFSVFHPAAEGCTTLAKHNECFFRNAPLTSADDELCYPALLNCSKFNAAIQPAKPLSWICTQYLDRGFEAESDPNRCQRRAFKALMACLYETGFNYSSEHHEESSWFTESRGIDPRVATIEAWQAASAADPLFVLDLPWLPTRMSVAQVAERTFGILNATGPDLRTAKALARFVMNHGEGAFPPTTATQLTMDAMLL